MQSDASPNYAEEFTRHITNGLPKFLGALLILFVGYVVAKLIATVIRKALQAASFDQRVHAGKGGNIIQRAIPNPSSLISSVAYYLIFLFALSAAVSALGIPALVELVHGIYAYIPNVIAALLIFLVAGAVSTAVATLVVNTMGDTPTGKIAATAVPLVVMGLATFMILNQLKIAPAIVTITYAGLIGTATLAFGLGGKDAASKMFMNLYETGQQKKSMAKTDFHKADISAKEKADDLRSRMQ